MCHCEPRQGRGNLKRGLGAILKRDRRVASLLAMTPWSFHSSWHVLQVIIASAQRAAIQFIKY